MALLLNVPTNDRDAHYFNAGSGGLLLPNKWYRIIKRSINSNNDGYYNFIDAPFVTFGVSMYLYGGNSVDGGATSRISVYGYQGHPTISIEKSTTIGAGVDMVRVGKNTSQLYQFIDIHTASTGRAAGNAFSATLIDQNVPPFPDIFYDWTVVKGIMDVTSGVSGDVTIATKSVVMVNGVENAYTKTEVDNKLALKRNVADSYTKAEVDNKLATKRNVADSYTKAETNNLLNAKRNVADSYNKTEVDNKLALKRNIDVRTIGAWVPDTTSGVFTLEIHTQNGWKTNLGATKAGHILFICPQGPGDGTSNYASTIFSVIFGLGTNPIAAYVNSYAFLSSGRARFTYNSITVPNPSAANPNVHLSINFSNLWSGAWIMASLIAGTEFYSVYTSVG